MAMASRLRFECCDGARVLAATLSMAAVLVCTHDVLAQGTDANRMLARTRMAEGRARRKANDLQGALESFRVADSLLHFPTTGLEVARAEADLGQLLQARETLRRVLDVVEPSTDLPQFQKARAESAGLLAEIERRIPTIRIVVTGAPAGAPFALAVDGETIAPAATAEAQPVNPGHHVVVAIAATSDARAEVDVLPQESKEVRICFPARAAAPFAAGAPASSVPGSGGAPEGTVASRGATHASPGRTDRTLEFVGFGVAGLGAAVSAAAGIASMVYTKSAEGGCSDGLCPPSTHDDLQTAHTLATVSNVFVIVTVVGAGAGLLGLLHKRKTPDAAPSVAVTPWLGLGAAGVRGTF
jgi:hypothetical protein